MKKKPLRRAVITGLGIISPLGIGKEKFWRNLLAGKSAIDTIHNFDPSSYPSKIAAEVKDFNPAEYLTDRQIKFFSKCTQFAAAASVQAIADARLEHLDPHRTSVIIGSALSAFDVVEENVFNSSTYGQEFRPGEYDPTAMLKASIAAPASAIALIHQIRGYIATLSSACASGISAIGSAADRIVGGFEDVSITGGADTPITRMVWNAFCTARFFSTSNEQPGKALRPFDKFRDKMTLGEGAAIFVLEEKQHALNRGARIYAEIQNFAHEPENVNELYTIDASAKKWAATIDYVAAELADSIDYISAHGPSDKVIDKVEAHALRQVFGDRLDNIPLSSIKGAIGAGMAGTLTQQLTAACLALYHDALPPNINFTTEDPECRVNLIKQVRAKRLDRALFNARAVGGFVSAMVLNRG